MLLLLRVLLQQVVMAVLLLQVELLVLVVVMAGDMPHNLLHMHQCWDLRQHHDASMLQHCLQDSCCLGCCKVPCLEYTLQDKLCQEHDSYQ